MGWVGGGVVRSARHGWEGEMQKRVDREREEGKETEEEREHAVALLHQSLLAGVKKE